MTPLQKKREQAWTQWKENAGLEQDDKRLSANFSSSDMRSAVHAGFDAMYAEHERIVKGLVEGLQIVKFLEQKVHWVAPINRDELRALIVKANDAIEAYKRECEELF